MAQYFVRPFRFPWQQDKAGDRSLDVEVRGPGTYGLFASVQQTNPLAFLLYQSGKAATALKTNPRKRRG